MAELNEGCRRARLLRDRCCHGDTNPVLQAVHHFYPCATPIPPTSSQGAIHICEVTFQWPFCIGTRNDGSSPTLFVLPLSTFRSNSFFLGEKIRPISTTMESLVQMEKDEDRLLPGYALNGENEDSCLQREKFDTS